MIQLRVRTEFTFGDTFAPLDRVAERLRALGTKAAGIADRGTWGHVQFDSAMRAVEVAPIFGVELVVVPTLEAEERAAMWFLAGSADGLKELYRFSSLAQRQSARGAARLTYNDVRRMSPEIEKFAGAVLDKELLKEVEAWIDYDPSSALLNRKKAALGMNERAVVISDNAYARIEDRMVFEMVGRGARTTPQHLLSRAELAAALSLPFFEAAERNVKAVAERCAGIKLPRARLIRVEGNLEELCREGIAARNLVWTERYEERLRRELELIRGKDFESYFLMVADMTRYAKRHMLVGPSRGSAAGSLVCYLTRITEVDPIPARLIFERFIDVTRADLPDIDLDFVDSKREMVFEYLRGKYGAANVARIGTVGTFQPKSALSLVAKRLGVPIWETAAVKDSIVERSSGDARANFALLDTLEGTEPGKKLLAKFPAMRLAADLEAHSSHAGVHASGVIVCNEAIENFCTVTADGIAQIDKKDAEKLNLLKIDVLGLRTLGVLEDAGVEVDWYGLKFDDPAVFKVLNDRRFAGIFQFEGQALQSIATQMTVESLDDIGHITALARPGPMASGGATAYLLRRAGKEKFHTPHPALDPYVRDTFGVVAYQENVLQICRELGDMSWEDVTLLRKAMSKSLGDEYFGQFRDKFIAGSKRVHGIEADAAKAIWEMVSTMGSWSFNKCIDGGTRIKLSSPGPYKANLGTGHPTIRQVYQWQEKKKLQSSLISSNGESCAPQRLFKVTKNGMKVCYEFIFHRAFLKKKIHKVICSADHKFIINGRWQKIGSALIGDQFEAFINAKPGYIFQRLQNDSGKGNIKPGSSKGNAPGGKGKKAPGFFDGRSFYKESFIKKNKNNPCQDCNKRARRMEAHHNDLAAGKILSTDLNWLCPSCHAKRHRKRVRYDVGLRKVQYTLIKIKKIGLRETFDIEMPKIHNFLLDNGLVSHNSHSYSYAIVSYWTAWLKAHHLLEFAAATLRNSKDDDSILKFLRELHREGVPYIAFDPERSEANWSVKEGKLIGGFMGLKGIGTSKAAKLIEQRAAAGGRLPERERAALLEMEAVFADAFPTEKRFAEYYTNPERFGIRSGARVVRIEEIAGEAEFVYIGRLVGKDLRDKNEAILIQRRNGKVQRGPTLFLDLTIEDDTGKILTRIERFDFEEIGRTIWDNAKLGSWWLVRAQRKLFGREESGFKMTYVQKIRPLPDPFAGART